MVALMVAETRRILAQAETRRNRRRACATADGKPIHCRLFLQFGCARIFLRTRELVNRAHQFPSTDVTYSTSISSMNVASVPVENSTSETTDTSLPGNRPWLLLTAAVDARNGVGCLFSRSEREKQYIHSFRHFLRFFGKNQDLCKGIVFCENSGADLAPFKWLVPF